MPFRFRRLRRWHLVPHPHKRSLVGLLSFRGAALAITAGLTMSTIGYAQHGGITSRVLEGQDVSRGPLSGFGTIERVGRLLGEGWGDGYHAGNGSGARPLANLPPKYRWQTQRHGATRPSPSYYDRFDAASAWHDDHAGRGYVRGVDDTGNRVTAARQPCSHCQTHPRHFQPAAQPQPRPANPQPRTAPSEVDEQPRSPSDLDVYLRVPAEQQRLSVSVTYRPATGSRHQPDQQTSVKSTLGRPTVSRHDRTSGGTLSPQRLISAVGLGHPHTIPGPGAAFAPTPLVPVQQSVPAALAGARIRQPDSSRVGPARSATPWSGTRSVPRVALAPPANRPTR